MNGLRTLALALCGVVTMVAASAQPAPQSAPAKVAGDYEAQLGPLKLVLHLAAAADGSLSASLDSPTQGVIGMACSSVTLDGGQFSFSIPSITATYSGRYDAQAGSFTGTWTQVGRTFPLVFARPSKSTFQPATKPSAIDGEWKGSLDTPHGSLPIVVHLRSDISGQEYATMDSPSQQVFALPGSEVTFDGSHLHFAVAAISGSYDGQMQQDGKRMEGTWTQGGSLPLNLTHEAAFVPAVKPSLVDGAWSGDVVTPGGRLRMVLQVKSDQAGREYVTVASPQQLAPAVPAEEVVLDGAEFRFAVKVWQGSFVGKVSADGQQMDGRWTQGAVATVHLEHGQPQSAAAPSGKLMLNQMQQELDDELKPMLENPMLAGDQGIGVAIGVIDHGQRRIFTYGAARPDSLFEIGSITKTFTSLILSRMVLSGAVTLETPVRSLLPAGTVAQPDGPEVTLVDLATHHSGLPRMPGNFHPADPSNPYADYTQADLYAFLHQTGLGLPAHAPFLYSNLGMGLLGNALANKAGEPYAKLLDEMVLKPLDLRHTFLAVPVAEQKNFLPGHTSDDKVAEWWDLNAMAPAGGIRSNIGDMLTYLQAQLTPPAGEVGQAIALQHQLRADADGDRIALNWMYQTAAGNYWHNGGTGGFTSYCFFQSSGQIAAVVLVNRSSALADSLGMRLAARMEGLPANPLRR